MMSVEITSKHMMNLQFISIESFLTASVNGRSYKFESCCCCCWDFALISLQFVKTDNKLCLVLFNFVQVQFYPVLSIFVQFCRTLSIFVQFCLIFNFESKFSNCKVLISRSITESNFQSCYI